MLTEERHDAIRSELSAHGRVVAAELAARFDVSEDTVRRDLRELARAGDCRRVYGGALAPAPDLGPLAVRTAHRPAAKARLAKAAAALVTAGQTIFIDAGSTNLAIAEALPRDLRLTVVTNAPAIATALADRPACTTLVLGGMFDGAKGACLGPQTIRDIRQIYADLVFLGACGVDPRAGVTALDAQEAEIKRAMLEQSDRLAIASTTDKLGTIAPHRIAAATAIDDLVIEDDVPAKLRAALRRAEIPLHVAR